MQYLAGAGKWAILVPARLFGYTLNQMCLAVPVKITSINGDQAEVDIGGVGRTVSIALTPEAKVGDYVLLHTGYAINVLDEAEARETLSLLERMVEAEGA